MEVEQKPESKLPLVALVTLFLLAILFPHGQNVIRHIELAGWEETEGTATYNSSSRTFWYNYTVGESEYTEWRHTFSWDDQPSFLEPISSDEIRVVTSENSCTKSISFSLTSGQTAYIPIRSTNYTMSYAYDFVDVTSTAGRVQTNHISPNQILNISVIYNEPGNTTDFYYTAPGDYTITLSNQKQRVEWRDSLGIFVNPQYTFACIGNHFLTIEQYSGIMDGDSLLVNYDPSNPDFAVLMMPEFLGTYFSIGLLFAAYLALLFAIFNSKPKPEEEEAEPEPEPEPEPEIQATEKKEPRVNGDGPSLILIIVIIIIAIFIIKEMGESGADFSNMNCNGGAELCLAPLAGAPALARSSSGKFITNKTAKPINPALAEVTHCLHTDSLTAKKCRRMVMRKSGLCYQHQDSDAAEAFLKATEPDRTIDVLNYDVDGSNKTISSKDIDGLVEALEKAEEFWVVDLGVDETEFVQFTYNGDIDDDGQRDGFAVFEHWRGGKMISRAADRDQSIHDLRLFDRLRLVLTGEEPDVPLDAVVCSSDDVVCEFEFPSASNNYEAEGRCWFCWEPESPEIVGLHMVGNDRNEILSRLDPDNELDEATYDRISQKFEAIHDREIEIANGEEGTPESRLETLKAMDDREEVLAEMAPHLDETIYEELGRLLDAHRERFRAWEQFGRSKRFQHQTEDGPKWWDEQTE